MRWLFIEIGAGDTILQVTNCHRKNAEIINSITEWPTQSDKLHDENKIRNVIYFVGVLTFIKHGKSSIYRAGGHRCPILSASVCWIIRRLFCFPKKVLKFQKRALDHFKWPSVTNLLILFSLSIIKPAGREYLYKEFNLGFFIKCYCNLSLTEDLSQIFCQKTKIYMS